MSLPDRFTSFINLHNELNELTSPRCTSWAPRLYLPPCFCHSQNITSNCPQALSMPSKPFDFSTFKAIDITSLTDVVKECASSSKGRTNLCLKYSLQNLKPDIDSNMSSKEVVSKVLSSEDFKHKIALIKSDFKLLFPLCGSNFIFKARFTKTAIKYNILCYQKRLYEEPKSKSSTPCNKVRKTSTCKAIEKESCCPFFVNLHLNLKTLNWYVHHNPSLQHNNHHPIKFQGYSIGKHQLSMSMQEEIKKLQSCLITSSIQQRILLHNSNITVPRSTLLNKHYSEQEKQLANATDAERLLDYLKTQDNISYFAMYANSSETNLLSIPKKRNATYNERNNVAMTGYVRVHPDHDQVPIAPNIDSTLQETLKDIIVHHKGNGNDVKILLTVGWACNEDIAVLRRFPEVLQMDTTFKTNREVRPLFNIVCKDSNNKLCTVFRCLLPSEKRSIFHSILTSVMPKVLGTDTCKKVKFIITDGDSQEIEACRSAVQTVFTNASHMSCLWHLIHQSISKTSKVNNPQLKDILKHWLYFTATNSESSTELNALLAHLKVRYNFILY